jgi:D-alanyl-D-alanine endopeptidase (penicillin-binding protein 7)
MRLSLFGRNLAVAMSLSLASLAIGPEVPTGSLVVPSVAEAATSRSKTKVAKKRTVAKKTIRKRGGSTTSLKRGVHKRHRGSAARRHRRYRRVAMTGSRAAVIMDAQTGEILYEKNAGAPRSIASLTKLMTGIVFLETDPDLDRSVTIARDDVLGSGKTQLRPGEVVTIRQLLFHSLMSSDNAATKTLVRTSDIPPNEFLDRMNRKASVLGLHNTRFVEFTGLDPANQGSAEDIAQLLKHAAKRPLIAEITSTSEYEYRSSRRVHHLVNSNRLARYHTLDVRSGKTGFISGAGYCVATWVRQGSRDLITVVLGAPSNPARFNETKKPPPSARRCLPEATRIRRGSHPGL